jgi:hypothetical protein
MRETKLYVNNEKRIVISLEALKIAIEAKMKK